MTVIPPVVVPQRTTVPQRTAVTTDQPVRQPSPFTRQPDIDLEPGTGPDPVLVRPPRPPPRVPARATVADPFEKPLARLAEIERAKVDLARVRPANILNQPLPIRRTQIPERRFSTVEQQAFLPEDPSFVPRARGASKTAEDLQEEAMMARLNRIRLAGDPAEEEIPPTEIRPGGRADPERVNDPAEMGVFDINIPNESLGVDPILREATPAPAEREIPTADPATMREFRAERARAERMPSKTEELNPNVSRATLRPDTGRLTSNVENSIQKLQRMPRLFREQAIKTAEQTATPFTEEEIARIRSAPHPKLENTLGLSERLQEQKIFQFAQEGNPFSEEEIAQIRAANRKVEMKKSEARAFENPEAGRFVQPSLSSIHEFNRLNPESAVDPAVFNRMPSYTGSIPTSTLTSAQMTPAEGRIAGTASATRGEGELVSSERLGQPLMLEAPKNPIPLVGESSRVAEEVLGAVGEVGQAVGDIAKF
jgi:hypothetical protein